MGRAAAIARQIGWYWGTLMGDNHYRRYVEHRRRMHPDEPVLSEREYWRMRHDAIDVQSQSALLLAGKPSPLRRPRRNPMAPEANPASTGRPRAGRR